MIAVSPASAFETATGPLLEARDLSAGYYGHAVIRQVGITVNAGEVVGILGANGAGKTTTLLTLAGELPPLSGEVRLFGMRTNAPLHVRATKGLAFVPEEHAVFSQLTVRENLRIARVSVEAAVGLFPELRPLLNRRGGLLSGGEQQMLALARSLSRQPRVLLGDELSHGLAPMLVQRLLDTVRTYASEHGVAVLLVEQHVRQLARVADRLYVMQRGSVVASGHTANVMASLTQIQQAYLTADRRN